METTVAVLGTGIMGAPIARNLLRAGFNVRVWNRTRPKAEPLATLGAVVCDEAAEAAAGASVVVTMLHDGNAVEQVMSGVLPAMEENAVWIQMSTAGVAATEALATMADKRGVPFYDAPVLGTKKPAEDGMLLVLAAGSPAHRSLIQPVFDAIGSRTIWVGEETQASRLKLIANSYVLALTTAVGEAIALSDGLGVDPDLFLDAIRGGPLDSAYTQMKGRAIIERSFPASFKTATAAKDAGLVAKAGRDAGTSPRVAEAVRDQMRRATSLGHGEEDMAAVYYAAREA